MSTPNPPSGTASADIARLDERVDGLEQSIGHVVTAVDRLGNKLDKASQQQWQLLLGVVGLAVALVGYIGTAWQAPISATLVRQESDIRSLQGAVVPRAEVNDKLTAAQRDNNLIRQRVERSEARVEKRLDRIEGLMTAPAWGKRS